LYLKIDLQHYHLLSLGSVVQYRSVPSGTVGDRMAAPPVRRIRPNLQCRRIGSDHEKHSELIEQLEQPLSRPARVRAVYGFLFLPDRALRFCFRRCGKNNVMAMSFGSVVPHDLRADPGAGPRLLVMRSVGALE